MLLFYIEGEPVGKSRPRFNSKTKIIYTPKLTKNYEERIGWECKKVMSENRFKCIEIGHEVAILLKIYVKNLIGKPDIDNIAKVVLDGLNGIAYVDDKQVTNLQIIKISDNIKRGIEVSLWQINR